MATSSPSRQCSTGPGTVDSSPQVLDVQAGKTTAAPAQSPILRIATLNIAHGRGESLNQLLVSNNTIENNLADVDFEKCKLCLKCVDVCDVRVMMSDNVPEEKIEKIHTVRLKREEKEKEKKRLEREKAKLEKANGNIESELKSDE